MSYQRDFLARKLRDPQAKFVHDLAQIQANQAAENVTNITSNLKGYSIKLQTKTTSKDKYYAHIRSYNIEKVYYTGKYPDYNNCRLFIRTENAGKMHDYSQNDNQAYVYGTRQVPDIYIMEDPNDPTKHEYVAYFNGTHYVNVHDRSILNLKSIVENETKGGFSFVRRWLPLKLGNSKQEGVILATHTSTSQNQYGYNLVLDDEGNFYFYVKYNYRQYFVKLTVDLQLLTEGGANFFYQNFKSANFRTELAQNQALTTKSYDVACTFDFATKEAVIELRFYDSELNTWTMIGRASSIDEAIPNKQMELPLQEGKWSGVESTPLDQVYDNSSNQYIGTINSPPNTVRWEDDNTLYSFGADTNSSYITVPNHTNINNLTEFTLAFWIKIPFVDNTNYINIIKKGLFSGNYFLVEKQASSRDLKFWFKLGASGDQQVTGNIINDGWNFVVCKWKTGEKLKISVNDSSDSLSSTNISGTFTTTEPFTIFDPVKSDDMTLIYVTLFSRQITSAEQTKLYNYGAHLSQWPKNLEPQQTPQLDPDPITVPYSTLYDLPRITVPVLSDYVFLNNPSADTPFASNYNCADGSPATIPYETRYNVPEGSGGTTTNPFVTVYTLAGASSTGNIDSESDEIAYGQYIRNTSGALDGIKPTEIQLWLNGLGNPSGGSVYLGIIKANGTYITFGTAIDPATIPDAWTSYTKQLLTNTYTTAVGDAIGVIWVTPGSGDINIRRGGSGVHASTEGSGANSCQNHYVTGDGWQTPNSDYSMAGTIKTGGDTVGTSPYTIISSGSSQIQIAGEFFGANSSMKDQLPTKVELKVYKKTGTTGSVSLQILTSSNALKTGGNLATWNIGTDPNIPTTAPAAGVLNLIWNNVDNTISIADGEKLVLNATTISSGGELYVMTNIGNNAGANNYHSSTSYYVTRLRGTGGIGQTWSSQTSYDLSGKISVGGQNFTAYKQFTATLTRIYSRALTIDSSFEGAQITRVKVRGNRVGTIPAPVTIFCYIRNNANAIVETIGSMDANTIGTTLGDIFFTNRGATHIVAVGDYISIEITSCNSTNYIQLNINNNVADAANSVLGIWDNNVATNLTNYDLAGTFFTGGQIDEESRIRVGQYINTQDSLFMTADSSQITYMELALIRVGSPTGNLFVNIRNENDTAIKTLYTGSVSGISTVVNSPTILFVNDLTNSYNLRAKDIITVEYDGGDTSNKIGVMVRTSTPNYDSTNSYIAKFNGIEYDYDTTKDLCAIMKTGGYTYLPDPFSLPPNMPQLSTDIYLGVRADKEGIYEKCISDLFMFTTEVLDTIALDNFCNIRMDFEDMEPDELLVTHHSFINAE